MIDEVGLIVDRRELDVGGQDVAGAELGDRGAHAVDDGRGAGAGQAGDRDHLAGSAAPAQEDEKVAEKEVALREDS